jgi:hypothetical protein
MSDTYHQFTTKTLHTAILRDQPQYYANLAWATNFTQYDDVLSGQGYQKCHRIGNRHQAMGDYQGKSEDTSRKTCPTANSSIAGVTCHPGTN